MVHAQGNHLMIDAIQLAIPIAHFCESETFKGGCIGECILSWVESNAQYSKERLTSFLFMASLATPMNVPAGINVPSNDVQSLRAFRVMSTELLRMNMSIMTNLNRMAYYFQCCSAAGILSENYRSCTSSASQLWSTHVFV